MKVIRVFVDEIPTSCEKCDFFSKKADECLFEGMFDDNDCPLDNMEN